MDSCDVLVVGGGITGAGILRDLALRGVKALLLEQGAPGQATTAASSHLIHGGLRYLLYDRLTTHATSWDAGNIVRIAPNLKRLPILWPVYRGHSHGPETVETLLECYDRFQPMKAGLAHLRLDAKETLRLLPGLKAGGLLAAASFDEWFVDAVGLVESNLAAARGLGAQVLAHTRVAEFLKTDAKTISGVAALSAGGSRLSLKAKVVINAAGPWADQVGRLAGVDIALSLRKGAHLVYDKPLVPFGLLLEALDRERYIFVIPHAGGTLVGPTDLPAKNIDGLKAEQEEVRYLLESVRRYLPDFPGNFARTTVGARPILGQSGSEKLLSREYEVYDHEQLSGLKGFITVAGGKMSDFRLMAKDAADAACRKLGRAAECRSHVVTLDGLELAPPPLYPRPWRPLKQFLRLHPRLREAHALAYLAAGFLRHLGRRAAGRLSTVTAEGFRAHYGM